MKIQLGSHVTTERGDGHIIGRGISRNPSHLIQLFDSGTVCSTKSDDQDYPQVTSVSLVTKYAIDNPSVPAGLRAFLLGDVADDPPKLLVPYEDGSGYLEIDPLVVDYSKQIFTHIEHNGTRRVFYVPRLYEIAAADPANYPLQSIELSESVADFIQQTNGINQKHVSDMSLKRSMEPGLILQLDDNTHIIIDGNHRYVKRVRLGRTHMQFYAFTEAEARPAKLVVPEAIARFLVT